MKDRLEQRLKQLKLEFEQGQKMLGDLEGRQSELRSTLLRISGAIQVMEEELAQTADVPNEAAVGTVQQVGHPSTD